MDDMSTTPANNINVDTSSPPRNPPRRRSKLPKQKPDALPAKRGQSKRIVQAEEDKGLNRADAESMSVDGETGGEGDSQDSIANQRLKGLASSYDEILNPGQGDDVESDLELELELTAFRKEEIKPRFKLAQDGVVCCSCGAITPDNMQHLTTYPAMHVCRSCLAKQERVALAPIRQEAPTDNNINLIQIHEDQLKNLERDMRLNLFGWIPKKPIASEQIEGLMKSSIIPNNTNEQDLQRSKAVNTDEETWVDQPCRGQSLVAGGMIWTAEESQLFFQGLRRFGKHNVWAIQEFIHSRSLAEVVTMVETMEMEVGRRKSLGLKTIRLSEMPMATEVNDQVIALEEVCASRLMDLEMTTFWNQHAKSPAESTPEVVEKSRLFNMRTLSDLSSRLYIQNEGAAMEREVVLSLYDALKEWLTPVVKELVVLQHERHRVTALLTKEECVDTPSITEMDVIRTLQARQLPLDVDAFFSTAHNRLQYMLFDDSAVVPETMSNGPQYTPSALSDYGKQYYLNATTDLKGAEEADSDQDMDTYDGVLAEEAEEDIMEAPLPVLRPSPDPQSVNSGGEQAAQIDKEQGPSPQQWRSFWSTRAQEAQEAQEISADVASDSAEGRLTVQLQSSESLPTMSYETWREDVARLEDYSLTLLGAVGDTDNRLNKHALITNVQSMNKSERSYEQRLYLEPLPTTPPSAQLEVNKLKRIAAHVSALDSECRVQSRYKNPEQPGYGPLPKNVSLLLDPTRVAPTTGYGVGKRDRGGLWQMDRCVGDSGYITVSDSDDEEEEDLGCQRQMNADANIERASQVLGWKDIFPVGTGSSINSKRQKRESGPIDPFPAY
ncbi:hypothetical protein EC957_006825 [Mortierella hygrophila]|uniref:Uncharacterized protein n=1 Tax=Mortierella hygrophila TaxID=979708 RepID=A0A9P6FE26_9FUNG|nr:hypothetical protein EC957_006825 [Mortierella hygrophila]